MPFFLTSMLMDKIFAHEETNLLVLLWGANIMNNITAEQIISCTRRLLSMCTPHRHHSDIRKGKGAPRRKSCSVSQSILISTTQTLLTRRNAGEVDVEKTIKMSVFGKNGIAISIQGKKTLKSGHKGPFRQCFS